MRAHFGEFEVDIGGFGIEFLLGCHSYVGPRFFETWMDPILAVHLLINKVL